MPVSVSQIRHILNSYSKQLKVRKDFSEDERAKGELASDVVTITPEGKRRDLLEKIGEDAVRNLKQSASETSKNVER